MNRRQLFAYAAKGVGAVTAGIIGIPALIFSLSPLLRAEEFEQWQPVAPVDYFPIGEIKEAKILMPVSPLESALSSKSVYVWRKGERDFVVYSRSCTDLGCPVNFDPGSEWFYCPCHGGVFDKEGNRRAGPPKAPLWRYQFRVREELLEVDLKSVPPMA